MLIVSFNFQLSISTSNFKFHHRQSHTLHMFPSGFPSVSNLLSNINKCGSSTSFFNCRSPTSNFKFKSKFNYRFNLKIISSWISNSDASSNSNSISNVAQVVRTGWYHSHGMDMRCGLFCFCGLGIALAKLDQERRA